MLEEDLKYIKECIELSAQSVARGDAPFGSMIVLNGEIIGASENNASSKISDHAEVMALHQAHEKLGHSNLTGATLYSNCEPCPMCSFMAREYKVSRVVYALTSPYMGGHSKWNIMEDDELHHFPPFFGPKPEVIGGLMEAEARQIFLDFGLWMFGPDSKAELEKRLQQK